MREHAKLLTSLVLQKCLSKPRYNELVVKCRANHVVSCYERKTKTSFCRYYLLFIQITNERTRLFERRSHYRKDSFMRRQNSTSKRRVSAVEDFDDVNHRESKRREAFRSKTHLDHWDIKQEAIQILHTDVAEKQSLADQRANTKLVFFEKALHPNGNFRRSFDLVTVVWVVVLAFMIPFEIGFGWYKMPTIYKTFSSLLDCWFALDIILNFRTGYILHGTVVMDDSKIIK